MGHHQEHHNIGGRYSRAVTHSTCDIPDEVTRGPDIHFITSQTVLPPQMVLPTKNSEERGA